MKKFILISIVLLFSKAAFSQVENDSIIINTLSFFNNKFHFNFEKAGEYILVFYEDDYYIIDKYYSETKSDLNRAKIIYKLQRIDDKKYSFSLIWSSKYSGSFIYENGNINKLRYVKSTE